MEKTLVVIKPDGVARGLVGEIIRRFERVGLKVVASKMLQVTAEHAEKHYPKDRDALWIGIGKKTLENYEEMGVDPKKNLEQMIHTRSDIWFEFGFINILQKAQFLPWYLRVHIQLN
jgi:nucleoside diphosphate kinase